MSKLLPKILVPMVLALVPVLARAQEATGAATVSPEASRLFNIIITSMVVLVVVSLALLYVMIELRRVVQGYYSKEAVAKREEQAAKQSYWTRLNTRLNAAAPLDREEEVLTDHEYDGIKELDNVLPPWWKALFYGTIGFGVFYLIAFHFLGWLKPQAEEYEREMASAKQEVEAYMATVANSIDETNVELDMSEAALAEGASIYTANCASCHLNDLGGQVGPNLVDNYWIHGGDIVSLFKTIKYGVPQKGMISWQTQLDPQQMQRVASYILSMQGTTPANPKEPQGELYQPESEPTAPTDSTQVTPADSVGVDSAPPDATASL